jgi:pimeloyl-ACP methyl ester carboxylesterase
MILPPILREDPNVNQTFQFTANRGTDPGLSVLELSQVQNPTVVTPKTPLKLVIEQPLAENEFILPIGYDGELFLPLGLSRRTKEGKIEIELQRLPYPIINKHEKSLSGAIRIFFQKLIKEPLGLFEYPLLAIANVDADETVHYEKDIATIKKAVAKPNVNRILLYIHGIIGDTLDMVRSVQRAQVSIDGQQHPLNAHYDLVLTFDYESLNTPIGEIARSLKQRLETVGLGANHDKTLHIVTHSMGGLVSRWFIEREGGNQVVQYLTMLGTPNAGSPWPTVKDWTTTATAIILNGFSTVGWPAYLLNLLIRGIEAVDVDLDQMKPNSSFLQELATSNDPNIPYAVIAGNTTLIQNEIEAALFKRLITKITDSIVALPFFGQPNDIAVTVESIQRIPKGRQIQPYIQEIACDHLTYFNSPAGLKALASALSQASNLRR